MCGFILTSTRAGPPSDDLARRLVGHRGPDGFGTFATSDWHLAHSRLAVLDPTAASDQPFFSPDGRWVLLFNGEVYNFRDLRTALSPRWQFRSAGDTEVVLAGLVTEGPEWLTKVEGMYALALVDRESGDVTAARDTLGIKPLYARREKERVVALGSTLRSVRGPNPALEEDALRQAVLFGTPLDRSTADADVTQLAPGVVWSLTSDGSVAATRPLRCRWWEGAAERPTTSTFKSALRATVRRHLVSDVPVGVALSGGLDSSTLVGLSVAEGQTPHCFTAAFPGDEGSKAEVEAATLLARHFNVPHTIVNVDDSDVSEALARPGLWDDPFAEIAAVPLNRVAAAARAAGVPVLLTGEGPDEFFGGYRRYERFALLSRLPRLPRSEVLRRVAARTPGRVARVAGSLEADARSPERYLWLIANLVPREAGRLLSLSSRELSRRFRTWSSAPANFTERDALELETKLVLPELYLRKVDLATMAEGIEGRVPFVDSVFLSSTFTHTPIQGKDLVRAAMADVLPREILGRPKQGFGSPMGRWVRTVLRSDVEEVLSDAGNAIWSVADRSAAQDLWERGTVWEGGYGGVFFALYRWGRWAQQDLP